MRLPIALATLTMLGCHAAPSARCALAFDEPRTFRLPKELDETRAAFAPPLGGPIGRDIGYDGHWTIDVLHDRFVSAVPLGIEREAWTPTYGVRNFAGTVGGPRPRLQIARRWPRGECKTSPTARTSTSCSTCWSCRRDHFSRSVCRYAKAVTSTTRSSIRPLRSRAPRVC